MSSQTPSRRQLLNVAAIAGAAPALAIATVQVAAYQGNMERALAALQDAFASLQAATPNKGGHRERAMDLVARAIGQVQAGIAFASAHGGG